MSALSRIERMASLLDVRPVGQLGAAFPGRRRAMARGRGLSFLEHREYQYGDDVRSIDWNVTARLGRPHVKLFEQERAGTALLVFDASASVTAWPGPNRLGQVGREVCAVLSLAFARADERVGLLMFSNAVESSVSFGRGHAHGLRIAHHVLTTRVAARPTDLSEMFAEASRRLRRRSLVIVVSDFLAGDAAAALQALSSRHEVVAILLTDSTEQGAWPTRGLVRVRDIESGEARWIDFSRAQTRSSLANGEQDRHEVLRAVCRKHAVPLVKLDVIRPYLSALQRLWRWRISGAGR